MSEKFHTQRLTFCHLANVLLSLPCFALKRDGNPVERFRSLCSWHDQLVIQSPSLEAYFKCYSFERCMVVTQLS